MAIRRQSGSKSDKWRKMRVLARSSVCRQHIPQTKIFSYAALKAMLSSFRSVYIKPRNGSFGKGIIRVYRTENGYLTHIGTHVKRHGSFDMMYSFITSKISGSKYIIQRAINSIKYQGSIVDFRVVVQINESGRAEVTGIAGRVSQNNRVVSNGNGGGAVGDLESFFSGRQYEYVKRKLHTLALYVMAQVRKAYPRQTEIGVDIAVDNNLKVWIIEHNYRPDHRMFTIIDNKYYLRRIAQLGARNGRRYRLG